ncbi:MAG: hypothetical protein K2Q15_01550, partial [Burkholderiales bacterium]|nr:hypothetical protein [Burkholderiales bacterium]
VSVAVWPDGIPIVIPPVDYLCIRRKKFAPKKIFRKSEDSIFLAWKAALPILQKHGTQDTDGLLHLDYLIPPVDIVQFIQRLPKEKKSIAGLARDRILDIEIYEQSISELTAT